MPVRFFFVSLFIFLGGVLSVPAAIAVWQEREVQDEDAFVSTVSDVFGNEEVQQVVATRLTETIMTRTDLQSRIADGLENLEARAGENAPPGIPLLAAPLTRLANETIYRICFNFLQSDAFQQVLETSARTMHRAVMAVVTNDSPLLDEVNGQVVLNLRPVIAQVIQELAGERAEAALTQLDIPEDAGMIVVSEESDHPWLWKLVRWIDDFNPVVPIIALIFFALGILLAKNRRRAVIATGATLALVAGLGLLALAVPVKELATTWPPTVEGKEAASEVYNELLDSFRQQQLFVVLVGLGMVVVGTAAGDRRVVRTVRSAVARNGEEQAQVGSLLRERAGALRLAGLAIAGIALILWPDPDLRTVITIVGLLAVYLMIIWIAASESEAAISSRNFVANRFTNDEPIQRTGFIAWLAEHAGMLRLLGIVLGAVLILFVWDLSLRGFVLIAAFELLYFAIIEWASTAARQPPGSVDY
jgi:hypothetical protein